jgi:hypothetical protein
MMALPARRNSELDEERQVVRSHPRQGCPDGLDPEYVDGAADENVVNAK